MEKTIYGTLFLIPNVLSDDNSADFIAADVKHAVHHVKHFIVENEKAARALIKKLQLSTAQQDLTITLWNEHSKKEEFVDTVKIMEGNDVGIISEAGLPCIADPGSDIVAWAHSKKIRVVPLPGASSIFMALMASGFNGQSFVFHGYLPIDKPQRSKKIKEMEQDALRKKQTQIFMETPYRNISLLDDLVKNCTPQTRLCIACDISSKNEKIASAPIKEWAGGKSDYLHKSPAIFLLSA